MSKKPKLFTNPKDTLTSMSKSISSSIVQAGVDGAQKEGLDVKSAMPNYLVVTEARAKKKGLIDLKPYFASSGKRKQSRDGGWYMTIPIRYKTKNMSYALYKEASSIATDMLQPSKTAWIDLLYEEGSHDSPSVPLLNNPSVSKNLTRIQTHEDPTRSRYIAFRTVSSKSKPSSWILGRPNANPDNMSKTMLENLRRLMSWKLKHM